MSNKIKLENLQDKLKEVLNLGYEIELKINGCFIPKFNILRALIPTTDNLKILKNNQIELKINGEYYEVKK